MNEEELTYEFEDVNAGDARLRELVLYVSDKCSGDDYFGVVKLNKILYFADRVAYARYGVSITGSEYLALAQGPAPRRLPALKESMLSRGEIVEQARTVGGGYTQRRIIPLRPADLTKFNGRDIAVVDAIMDFLKKKTASDVSYFSHGRAWRIAHKAQCPMPYEASFVANDTEATEYESARGLELAEKHAWGV